MKQASTFNINGHLLHPTIGCNTNHQKIDCSLREEILNCLSSSQETMKLHDVYYHKIKKLNEQVITSITI